MTTLIEKFQSLANRADKTKGKLETEEATKNSLIMPFISALGYDVFDIAQVVPEYTADVGTKKGEKVDYALLHEEKPVIFIECKKSGETLDRNHASQLTRYFNLTPSVRVGVLTNGTEYRFYTDLEEPNCMDEQPFQQIDLFELKEDQVADLEPLTRQSFDLDTVLESAVELKYMSGIRTAMKQQFEHPEEKFVRFFFNKSSPDQRFTSQNKELFTRLVRRVLTQIVNDKVHFKIRSVLNSGDLTDQEKPLQETASSDASNVNQTEEKESGIVTTNEELDGFRIVKAIVCNDINLDRVSYRDQRTYFSILIDNNNRRPLCRLYFDGKKKYVELFGEDKKIRKHEISEPNAIYGFKDELRSTVRRYPSNVVEIAKKSEEIHQDTPPEEFKKAT